jgi:hypothetical protein
MLSKPIPYRCRRNPQRAIASLRHSCKSRNPFASSNAEKLLQKAKVESITIALSLSCLNQAFSSLEVGASVGLGLLREGTGSCPKVDQGLHWLQLVRLQHVNLGCGQDEVAEAAVQGFLDVQVVERLDEVGPVKVSVNSEHLAEDCLADVNKLNWETAALSGPIACAGKLGQRGVERGWTSCNWSVGTRSIQPTRCKAVATNSRGARIVGKGDTVRISREDIGVVNFAGNPALHKRDILMGWDFDWLLSRVQPGERVITKHN